MGAGIGTRVKGTAIGLSKPVTGDIVDVKTGSAGETSVAGCGVESEPEEGPKIGAWGLIVPEDSCGDDGVLGDKVIGTPGVTSTGVIVVELDWG